MSAAPADAELREALRAAGLRATAARVAVLRVLHGNDAPSSHPEITAALAEDGWDRATLYRNLVDLTEARLLRRVDLGDHLWRYELLSAPKGAPHEEVDHPHFLCTTCGDLACLPPMNLALPKGQLPRALLSGQVAIQLRGVCDRCREGAPDI